MTTKLVTSVLGLLLLLITGFKSVENSTLNVEVSGFGNESRTKIWVSVFVKEGFLESSLQTKSILASGNKVKVEFELPEGEYAVSTYHDSNGNDKLDRYFFGKPKEPYGFSNNVKTLGPPAYEKCKIQLGASSKTISINLID